MTQQIINLGTAANARDGDPIRLAFQKVNANFNEIYGLISGTEDTSTVIKDTAAEILINGVHDGITVDYNSITKTMNLTVSTSAVAIDLDGGSSSTVYDFLGLNIDGGSASSTYSTADYTDGLSNIWRRVAWSADTW